MRINNIQQYPNVNRNAVKRQQTNTVTNKQPSFGSIYSDANIDNQIIYAIHIETNPDFSKIKNSSTRIFRELSNELAVAKLINPTQKTEIKVLGSSDGSEVWGQAIAIKEHNPDAVKNVNIKGTDIEPYMTEVANTGCIVMSDVERIYANQSGTEDKDLSPIKGSGWSKYLRKTKRPKAFNETLKKYPVTKYIEFDPAAGKRVGAGLDWYEIKKKGLPDVTFETGDMRKSLKPSEDADCEIYVMANSSAYVLEENPDDFIKLFKDIKEETRDKKDVYVVLGDVEDKILRKNIFGDPADKIEKLNSAIDELGYKNIQKSDLDKLGIKQSEKVSHNIYKLEK